MIPFKVPALVAMAALPALAFAQSQPTPGQVPGAVPTLVPQVDKPFVPATRLEVADAASVRRPISQMRTAVAIVNGEVLTNTDVEDRLKLNLLALENPNVPEAEVARLRTQVLRNLVDESLQIQAAEQDKLTVDDAAVNARYAAFAQQFGRTPKQMDDYLRSVGSSPATLKRQIKAESAWQKVLGRRVGYFVNVSDDEVNGILDKLKASQGQTEFRVGEIYLSTPAGSEAQVNDTANKILEQLRAGGNFQVYARQFSEASTAAVGGDLGWVRPEQLPPELARVAQELTPGQVNGPIAVPGGISIMLMIDKRQVLTADPRQARLALKQVSIAFPPGATEATAKPTVERFREDLANLRSCDAVEGLAQRSGAEIVDNDQVTAGDLPPQISDILLSMPVGQATPPFGSLEEGVRALVLCGRSAPPAPNMPTFDQIKSNLESTRTAQSGRRYLRDLRRDAVIEYR